MIYKVIKELCKRDKISVNGLEQKLGFAKGSLCRIDVNKPSMEKIQKIADYFGVAIDYLMTGEDSAEKKKTTLTPADERDISIKLDETLNQLTAQDGLMFDGEAIDEETRRFLRDSLENTIRTSKILAKQKFTPKKYRKDE